MFSKIFLLVKPLKPLFLSLSLFALIFVGVESLADSNLDSSAPEFTSPKSAALDSGDADSSLESALDKKAQKAQEKLEKKAQKEAQKQAKKDSKDSDKSSESSNSSKSASNALNPQTTEQDAQEALIQDKKRQLYFLRAQYYQYLLKKAQEQENISKNGWFLGAILGTSQIDATTRLDSTRTISTSINPLAFGAMGGYLRFIGTAPIGVRVYGQYIGAANFASGIEDSISTHLASFNIDVVGDLPIAMEGYYLGVYVGVGAGVQTFSQKSASENISAVSVGSVINFGLAVTLDFKHRLEAGLKVPPSVYNQSYSFGLMYLVGYQYLF